MTTWRESTNRTTVFKAVQELKRQVECAYFFSLEDQASRAHDELIAAEWRLRQIDRRAQ